MSLQYSGRDLSVRLSINKVFLAFMRLRKYHGLDTLTLIFNVSLSTAGTSLIQNVIAVM